MLKEKIEWIKEKRRRKQAYYEATKDWKFEGLTTPVLKVFGQYIAFPCGSPKQFWRAATVTGKLCRLSTRAAKRAEKLEAQLLKIQELHSQLSEEKTTCS